MASIRSLAAGAAAAFCLLPLEARQSAAFYAAGSGLLPIANEVTAEIGAVDPFTLEPAALTVEPDLGVGFGLSTAIGAALLPGLRLEVEGSLLGFTGDRADFTVPFDGSGVTVSEALDTSVTVVTWMVNGYYEPALPLPVTPYVGAGVGIAGIEVEASDAASGTLLLDEATVFAVQLLAGASLPIAPGADLFGGYRFLTLDRAELTDSFGAPVRVDFTSHALELGVRFGF